jgi:hypothetical protein
MGSADPGLSPGPAGVNNRPEISKNIFKRVYPGKPIQTANHHTFAIKQKLVYKIFKKLFVQRFKLYDSGKKSSWIGAPGNENHFK